MCVDLVGIDINDRVIDIACGTGGFLVSAFDEMLNKAKSKAAIEKIKDSIFGFDTNPTVYALSTLNMFFRGDGKSHISNDDCFDDDAFAPIKGKQSRAFLNPPFSQEEEPEKLFINRSMETLEPGGMLAVVVYAGIFADNDHIEWRKNFLRKHRLLGVISLPEDLFYPTAAPTSIMIAEAHIPISNDDTVFMARVWNDGFEKLKGRRVPRPGNQIPEIIEQFTNFKSGDDVDSEMVTVVTGEDLIDGKEWSPQEWLPQPSLTEADIEKLQDYTIRSVFQAVSQLPDLADIALSDFGSEWQDLPDLPTSVEEAISFFFDVTHGKSYGLKHFSEGITPYISSGDSNNSVLQLVEAPEDHLFPEGGITVTAFGLANLQPWPYVGRGNGGSAVRVLLPKYNMSLNEMVWFITQINAQRWRFFYARMAIKSRLERLTVLSPPERMPDTGKSIQIRLEEYRKLLDELSQFA